jgi:hypothetical protein
MTKMTRWSSRVGKCPNVILSGLAFILAVLLTPTLVHAFTYRVTLDTRGLASQPTPPGPFSLEFQLIGGDGAASNTVVISNVNFGRGGRAFGGATVLGGADGDLSSAVVLTDVVFLNEFTQPFTPSSLDPLSFTVDITNTFGGPTPDAFSIGILDSSGKGLPTTFFDAFMQIDITASPTQVTYASDPNTSPPSCPTCAPINLAAPAVKTITAPCDVDVTNRVTIDRGPVKATGVRGRSMQQVRITNTSNKTIDGDILLALDGLPSGVDVLRADGVTTCPSPIGSPFVEAPGPGLRPKKTVVVTLQFANPQGVPITYTPRVLLRAEDDKDHDRGGRDH